MNNISTEDIGKKSWLEEESNALELFLINSFTKDTKAFTKSILDYLAELSHSYQGLFFIQNTQNNLFEVSATYACVHDKLVQDAYALGDGIVGQAALSNKKIYYDHIPAKHSELSFSPMTNVYLDGILAMPFSFNDRVFGVIELIFIKKPHPQFVQLLERINRNVAAVLESILATTKNKSLILENENYKMLISKKDKMLKQKELENQKLKEHIASQQKAIVQKEISHMEDLNAAKRIQSMMFKNTEKISNYFTESFFIQQKKEVISGNFCWFHQVNRVSYLALVDCKVHGLIGVSMSMMMNTLLNQVVVANKIRKPGLILKELDHLLCANIVQNKENDLDGISVTLCVIEEKNQDFKVSFGGAQSQFFFLKSNKFFRIEGNKKGINGLEVPNNSKFHEEVMYLQHGDVLYLCTDGILNSCNERNETFGRVRFENTITENKFLNLDLQGDIILRELDSFRADTDLVDDITLIGLKF
jgi:serine phosphatase RsbU (regulator of sigma subunit)